MPLFLYKAKRGPSEIVEGEVEAENEDEALAKITASGLFPIKLRVSKEASVRRGPADPTTISVSTVSTPKPAAPAPEKKSSPPDKPAAPLEKKNIRIPFKELNVFTRQFAILLKASVPLLKIFQVLQTQTQHPKFKRVLSEIEEALRQGASLSETMSHYPKIFSQIYVNMVNSGEVSGTLDKVLLQLSEFAEKEAEIRGKVQAAVVYPIFLVCAGAATVFILLTFVMPRLIDLFSDLGTTLPMPTRVVIALSHFFQKYWIVMMVAFGALIFLMRSKGLTPGQRKAIDQFALKIPLFGNLLLKTDTTRFLRSLDLLYENGIPLYQAVRIAARSISNEILREEIEKIPAQLEGGETLAHSLEKSIHISPFVAQMVSIGEESGQLGSAVRETANFYEQQINQAIKVGTSLLEPFMILIIGLVIGFIVIAMLLPIFEIHVFAS